MEELNKMCKVCHHEDSPDNPLCFPCKCKGTIKYIHKDCLFLFIESSKKNFCTICKHNYKFVDIFKPDMPKKVPLRLILRGLSKRLKDFSLRVASNLLTMLLFLFIFTVNGFLILNSSGFGLGEAVSISGGCTVLIFGILITIISYINYHLYFNLGNYIRQVETRRTLRIDPLSAMNSIATDALTSTDMDMEGHARTFLSSITLSLNENMELTSMNDQEGVSNDPESSLVDSEESTGFVPSETRPALASPFILCKCINISAFWWVVTLLSNSLTFNLGCDFSFLRKVYLYRLTKHFFILYMVLLCLVGLTRILHKSLKLHSLKIVYSFTKIYHMLFLCLFHFIYFQGVGVHYIFSEVINGGETVLDLEFSYFRQYKTLLSLLFHFILGYFVTCIARKTLINHKNKMRRGLFYFISEPSSNDLAFVYNISHEQVFTTILRDIIYGIFTLLSARYILYILRGSMSNGYYSFSIRSVNKLLLLFKVVDLVSGSFSFFHRIISGFVNLVIRLLSLFFGLSNYLYGDVAKVDKTDLRRFKWFPNKDKYYQSSSVRRKTNKRVSHEDVERFFNRPNDRNYSVFYVPVLYRYKCMIITFLALTTYVSFYLMLFRVSNYVASFFNAERFFDNSSDIVLIVITGLILQLFRLFVYLATSVVEMKGIWGDILDYSKQSIVLLFSIIIWPLWSAFIVLILYSESLSLSSISPGRLVSLFFSSSSIISLILNRIIFTRPVRNYSFGRIFKKLYGFISAMTFIIICISLLRSYSFLVVIESSEIPFLLIFGISASLFYLKHCIKNVFYKFLENVKKEHYLLDRQVLNYVSQDPVD